MLTRLPDLRSIVVLYRIAALAAAGLVFGTMLGQASAAGWIVAAAAFFAAVLAGSSYRFIIAVWTERYRFAAASWSGGAAAAAWLSLALCATAPVSGIDPLMVAAAHGTAINLAYALARGGCLLTGCCATPIAVRSMAIDIRWLEIVLCGAVAALTAMLAQAELRYAGLVGIAGYLALRQFALSARGGHRLWWPPLRQPGIDLFPHLLLGIAVASAFVWQ
ncbi:hypothetical protein [Devosia ginsengisoli]|uniref:hypothetical protein n=1 Tax=Devosia ginsengisoli TaxID=400770 RepID=UPI0026F30918|nr:hypothetical protein [Devosia ginsengisoli]MCR6670123.1 hypothetical protein [Devosia ginsengisoli]